jgi:Leucine-rich repeat (LRR) protein
MLVARLVVRLTGSLASRWLSEFSRATAFQVGSDVGLVYLKALSQLQRLYLKTTKISDSGLVHLRSLPQLQYLYLDATQISDAGLVNLKELTSLKILELSWTKVTEGGIAVAELHKALPKCAIVGR